MLKRVMPWRAEKMFDLIAERAAKGEAAPSYHELAHAAGLKDAGGAVRAALVWLESEGRITADPRNRVSVRYRVNASGRWTGYSGKAAAKNPRRRGEYASPANEMPSQAASRACLCCGRGFMSEGIHNRLCESCKRGASNASPLATAEYGVRA